jgi:hypothetical protein
MEKIVNKNSNKSRPSILIVSTTVLAITILVTLIGFLSHKTLPPVYI